MDKEKQVKKTFINFARCLCIKCPSSNICMKIRLQKVFCATGKTRCDVQDKGCLCPECRVALEHGLDKIYYCK